MSAKGEVRQMPPPAAKSRFRDDVARVFVDSLKENDITFSVLLPLDPRKTGAAASSP